MKIMMRSKKIWENIKIFQRHPAQLSIKEKQNKISIRAVGSVCKPAGILNRSAGSGAMQAWRQDNFAGALNRPAGSEAMSGKWKSKKLLVTSFKCPYSNLELLDRIKTSEWVKWQPCRGYGRLLAVVVMPTVLKILS